MHSFIVSPNSDLAITAPVEKFTINPEGVSSIGIKQIRELLTSLSHTAAIPRIIWIEPADSLTSEASNALLKALEEPPHNTTFYLATTNPGALLPTVRSRCQIIKSTHTQAQPSNHLQVIKSALPLSLGDRLTLSQTLPSDRAELVEWCNSLQTELHTTIGKTSTPQGLSILAKIASNLSTLISQLQSNVSVSLAISNFLLHLPKTK